MTCYLRALRESYTEIGIPHELYFDPTLLIPSGPVVYVSEDDGKVCAICDEYEGQEYEFDDDEKPPVPQHPWCRCKYVYVDTGDVIHFGGSDYY